MLGNHDMGLCSTCGHNTLRKRTGIIVFCTANEYIPAVQLIKVCS